MSTHPSAYPPLLPCLEADQVRYYSLARHALVEGLRLCGVTSGSRVLLPAFICRDVLAAVHACGAEVVWYDVSPNLTPHLASTHWPEADVVLAVNYFGFPQNLSPFEDYARRTNAKMIEDNAHGYGSRDETGLWLGLRSKIGIFSIRKTLRIPDGAALAVRDIAIAQRLSPQLPFNGVGVNTAQLFKARLRSLLIIGEALYRLLLKTVRAWRRRGGGGVLTDDPSAEQEIPFAPEPWKGLQHAISAYNFEDQAARRRKAYLICALQADKISAVPVFKCLPEGCVPYGFAFRGGEQSIDMMNEFAKHHGWDCVVWPDLPNAIRPTAPDYYRNIHLINFLW